MPKQKRSQKEMENRRLNSRWWNMKARCYNPKHPNYILYGARGITICDEWLDYGNYKKWMYDNGYTDERRKELSVDRIDNDGPYSPENCRLVSADVQLRNRRCTRWVEDPDTGEKMPASEYAALCGRNQKYISALARSGMPLPRIPKNAKRYGVVACIDGDRYKSFRTRDDAMSWWRRQSSKITSCLMGERQSVVGLGWYYVDDAGNMYKEKNGEYVLAKA